MEPKLKAGASESFSVIVSSLHICAYFFFFAKVLHIHHEEGECGLMLISNRLC